MSFCLKLYSVTSSIYHLPKNGPTFLPATKRHGHVDSRGVVSMFSRFLLFRPWQQHFGHSHSNDKKIFSKSAPHLRSCRFITVARARLKVPAKNPTALLFLSRGKQEERKTTTTIQCFFMEWVKWDMLSAHICSQREKWHAKVQICYAQKLFSNNTIVFETFAFHHLPILPLISCCL